MLINRLIDWMHVAQILSPVADFLAGTVSTACVRLGIYQFAHFLISCGVGTTGTSQITVEACSDSSGTGAEAIPFYYNRQAPGNNTNDAWTGYQQATAAGFLTTAGSHKLICIDVDSRDLPAGKEFVRVKGVESVDAAVIGGVICLLSNARYHGDTPPTALA